MVSQAKEHKRSAIREAATKLFAEKGYEITTTRDICRAAKISNAALYYYFDSKEDILYQILDETMRTGLERIVEIEKTEKPLKEKLSDILKMHAARAVDYHKMKLLVHDQKSLLPEHKEALVGKQRIYVQKIIDLLDDLKAQGELADLDTKVCSFAFFGMVSWAYRWFDPRGRISPEELSTIFNRIFTKGIFRNS